MSDPKYTLRNLVDEITTTIDDGSPATIIFLYAGGPETLKTLFLTYDVIVTFHDATTRPGRYDGRDLPTYYPAHLPVHVITIDKDDADGVRLSTATKMQWKMKVAMRAIIAANAQVGPVARRILEERANDRWIVGLQVWESVYIVEHKEA